MSLRPSPPTLRRLRNVLPVWLREAVGRRLSALGYSLAEFGTWLREND